MLHNDKFVSMEIWTDFKKFIDKLVSESIRDVFDFFSLWESGFYPCYQKENSKCDHDWVDFKSLVKEPSKVGMKVGVIDDFDPCKDENRTEDDRSQDPIKEYLMLIFGRNLKKAKNQNKDKEVVHRERFFYPVGRLKLAKCFKSIHSINDR